MTLRPTTLLGVTVGLAASVLFASVLTSKGHRGARLVWQEEKPAEDINEKLSKAYKLATEGQSSEARALYEEAAELARAKGETDLQSRALEGIGRLFEAETRYTEAARYLEEALLLAEGAGAHAAVSRLANSLGAVFEQQGLYKEARSRYERSLRAAEAANDPRLSVRAIVNLAGLKPAGTDLEPDFNKAVEIARSAGEKDLEASVNHDWGDYLFQHGEYARASEKLSRAATLYEEVGNQEVLARVYTSMGRLNRAHGRAAEAISLYEKALKIQREVADRLGVIQTLNAMCVAYDALGDSRRSGECYERAYALALETGNVRTIDFISANLARSLIDRHQWARAAEMLEAVVRRGLDQYPSIRHNLLSWAYENLGRLDESLQQAQWAVEAAPQGGEQEVAALLRRAAIREHLSDFSNAEADALEVIRSLEAIRARLVPLDYMKQGFSLRYQESYSLLIGIYYRSAEAGKALEVSELARARAFLDLLATRKAGLGTDAVAGGDSSHTGELVSSAMAPSSSSAEIAAAAARLRSVILSYWVTPDALYVWSVDPSGKIGFRRIEVSEKRLVNLVAAAATAEGSKNISKGASATVAGNAKPIQSSRTNWQELYRLLIRPVRKFLPPPGTRLTIVPHGPLMRLPFAALADENGRYLLEDHPIHYIPAAALLQFTSEKARRSDKQRRFLLVADPAPLMGSKEKALPPLPGARQEVRRIAALLPAGAATILEGQRAGEREVIEAMSKASVLHFATHGIARDDQPLDSYLALARDSSGNGRLTAERIYRQNLHAEMVVLSACRSGGEKMTGEGIAVLSRAFFYAGSPSLVISFWDVADETASRLLPDFYSAWLRGRERIEALQQAQLRLLADLRAGRVQAQTPAGTFTLPEHPILWAGFGLLGEP